jgi:hypothetical protein
MKPDELTKVFEVYLQEVLLSLRIRVGAKGETLEADVIEVDPRSGQFQIRVGTLLQHKQWLPPMQLRVGADGRPRKPRPRDGVAAYCLWANRVGKYGVAVAHDVASSADIEYFEETTNPTTQPIGEYKSTIVKDMYRRVAGAGNPPYRSLLSAAIMRKVSAYPDPKKDPDSDCAAVLNITSTRSKAFSHADVAWAQACASLLGSLYECHAWHIPSQPAKRG